MTTLAKLGWGSEFHMGDVGGTLAEIAEVISIQPPTHSADTVEATHMKSPARFREFIAGLLDGGEADIQTNLAPGSVSDLAMQAAVGEAQEYKIVIPSTGGQWQATGALIVTGYVRETPIDDRMTATLSVKFSGASTEAAVV